MHKTIILDRYVGGISPFQFCYTYDTSMFICREACEALARKKSPTHHYVVTFSDEYSPGYRRIQLDAFRAVKTKSNTFTLTWKQQSWIRDLWLKTINDMIGFFYVKITPFE